MEKKIAEKILVVQDMALEDARYKELLCEHESINRRFVEILPTLSKEQQDVVMDYVGLAFAMHLRLLELSCTSEEKT